MAEDNTKNLAAETEQENEVIITEYPDSGLIDLEGVDLGPQMSFFEIIETVPDPIKKYLLSDELDLRRGKIYQELELTQEDKDIALYTEYEVFFETLPLTDYPDELWSRLPWEDSESERCKKLVEETIGQIFLPATAHLGDVIGLMERLGMNPEKYDVKPIEVRKITYDEAVKEIVEAVNLGGLTEREQARLEHIIESRLREVRDDSDTASVLTKPKKIGGLELTDLEADRVVKVLRDEARMTKYVEVLEESAESVDMPETSAKEYSPEEIKAILAGSAEEQKEVATRLQKMSDDTGNNADLIRENLYKIIFPSDMSDPDKIDVAAAVVLMARRGDLIGTLADDERFKNAIAEFSTSLDEQVRTAIIDYPAGVAAMNYFLQIVMRGLAKFTDNDSARYGLRVINALKKRGETQYAELVAFDMDKGEFVWTEPLEI